MKNNNLLYLIIVVLIVLCLFLWNRDQVASPTITTVTPAEKLLSNYIFNTSLLSSGMNFDTGKVVVLNNLTGEKVEACKEGKSVKGSNGCGIKILNGDKDLMAALRASETIFDGKVLIGGEAKNAKVSTQVTLSYNGSMCTTNVVGGVQFTNCVEKINYCNSMISAIQAVPEPLKTAILNYLSSIGCENAVPQSAPVENVGGGHK